MRKLSLNQRDLKSMKHNHGGVNSFVLYHATSMSLCTQVGGLVIFSRLLIQWKQLVCFSWIGVLVAVIHLTLSRKKIWQSEVSCKAGNLNWQCVNIKIMKNLGFNYLKIRDVCVRCSCLICSQVCITVTVVCWGFILYSRNTTSWAASSVLAAFAIKI